MSKQKRNRTKTTIGIPLFWEQLIFVVVLFGAWGFLEGIFGDDSKTLIGLGVLSLALIYTVIRERFLVRSG
jgi:high-affinity Fe2+/Pb2+ permease